MGLGLAQSSVGPIRRALVTGGAGYLGRGLVAALRAEGVVVRVLDLRPHPDPQVDSRVGDIAAPGVADAACEGMDVVFHAAARIDWSLNKRAQLQRANVEGTERVIAACIARGVGRLVYTSSVDVMSGGGPVDGGDEGWPIPEHHFDDYGRTKAEAERLVLGANGKEGLYTCALRVANIWGPGNPILVPRFVGMARRGPLVGLGDGRSLYSFVYIDHAVRAHLLAAVALAGAAPAGGEAFFIVDEPPVNFFRFFTPILEAVGLRARWWFLPAGLVWPVARISEAANRRNLTGDRPPALTRFTVSSVSKPFWFKGDKAARILGYRPTVTQPEAVAATARWIRDELLPAGG